MKEASYFIDTNIFLRVIVKDNPRKVQDCERFFEQLALGKIQAVTSNLVLAELVWTGLSFYKLTKFQVINIIAGIIGIKGLTINDDGDIFTALDFYKNNSVKFVDALIASHQSLRNGKAAIVSYDTDFDKLGLKRIEPSALI